MSSADEPLCKWFGLLSQLVAEKQQEDEENNNSDDVQDYMLSKCQLLDKNSPKSVRFLDSQ